MEGQQGRKRSEMAIEQTTAWICQIRRVRKDITRKGDILSVLKDLLELAWRKIGEPSEQRNGDSCKDMALQKVSMCLRTRRKLSVALGS